MTAGNQGVENEATQRDWMGDLSGGLGFDPAVRCGRCSAAAGRTGWVSVGRRSSGRWPRTGHRSTSERRCRLRSNRSSRWCERRARRSTPRPWTQLTADNHGVGFARRHDRLGPKTDPRAVRLVEAERRILAATLSTSRRTRTPRSQEDRQPRICGASAKDSPRLSLWEHSGRETRQGDRTTATPRRVRALRGDLLRHRGRLRSCWPCGPIGAASDLTCRRWPPN